MHSNQLIFLLVCCLVSGTLQAQQVCLVPVEPIKNKVSTKTNEIAVTAENVNIQQDTIAEFNKRVEISSDSASITAEHAKIDRVARKLVASGDIKFQDGQIQVASSDLLLDLDSGKMKMQETKYRMINFQGRGDAQGIELNKEQGITLNNVSFSTCPEKQEDWRIEASSIELEPGELWGKTRNTRFYVKGIPVFYLPYFQFPVTDQRQSGLLFPVISSSDTTGVSYEQPIYWNIAPNMDATFAPRYMTSRGLQLKNQFRYLTENHRGELHFDYMHSDTDTPDNDSRYFYRLTHSGALGENWYIGAEINGLSDDNYIVDLGSEFYNRADTHLFKTVALGYVGDHIALNATVKDFEVIGDHPNSYRAIPEIKLDYAALNTDLFELNIHSELAHFDSSEPDLPKATRFHIAPTLSFPYRNQWSEFLAETSLLHTSYSQSNIENTTLAKNVDRTIGQARIYGSIALERDANWFGAPATQTLEPKFQYLYTSYENQSDIGFYDTARLLNDFDGLFRGQEFTGLDRISDKNQFTMGVTTRYIDQNNREQFRLSLGQIFYFDDNQVIEATKANDRSAVAIELDWNITTNWFSHTEVQISSKDEKIERSNMSLEYRLGGNNLIQVNHRYVRDLSGEKIDQLGLTAAWTIADNWQWVGRYYRDMNLHRTTESYTGVQYDSCCWSLQIVWERHLSNRFDALGNQSIDEYDSGIKFKFAFNGMGQRGAKRTLLNDGLFGYRRPYLLNN